MEAQQQSLLDLVDEPPKVGGGEKSFKLKKLTKSSNTSLNSSTEKEDKKNKKKGQKLYCVCQTPYDKTK
jgi:hypothetical protein